MLIHRVGVLPGDENRMLFPDQPLYSRKRDQLLETAGMSGKETLLRLLASSHSVRDSEAAPRGAGRFFEKLTQTTVLVCMSCL